VHLGGAGARRGGGVSGIPGRNAAMAILSGAGRVQGEQALTSTRAR
jgi:phytoene dehydrogenase-like protein